MNPEVRTQSEMTVNTLMELGKYASAAIAVIIIVILGMFTYQRLGSGNDPASFWLVVAICAVIALVGVLIINYLVQRKIKDRLIELENVCRDITKGNRGARAIVNGDDEFARLAHWLNTLLDNQSIAQSSSSVSTLGNDAAALQAQIEKLLQEVSAVGDGDLRVQAEVTPDTLGVLADSFNYMIEELAKVVGRVQSTAVQVTQATRRILDRSAELAQASETQVTQISQTTEAVEALASFIQNVAHNALLSAEAAQDALHNAQSGQMAVRQSIEGMMLIRENVQETSKKIKRLGERSNEIGEIVRIIEDIADQTNLLALNAAIQSAMAGEHGRGFAVVADEIRLLAERSTESTKRIATLIKSIQGDTYEAVVAMEDSTQEVVKGSQLADEAGRALNSIYSAVERQAQMIESIAHTANDQTSVSEAVAIAMTQISDITRQTNVGTQEAAASVSYLADLAEQLRASVSTFRLPEQGNEMIGSFPSNIPVLAGFSASNGNQLMAPGMSAGGQNAWTQNNNNLFSFPDSSQGTPFIAAPSHSGQIAFESMPGFAPSDPFGSQPSFTRQQYNNQQGFGSQQPFGSQPGFVPQSNGSQQPFNSQPGFGSQPPFNSQQSFGSQQPFNSSQGFDSQQPFNGQQSFDEFASFDNGQPFVDPRQSYHGDAQAYPTYPNSHPGQPVSPSTPGPQQQQWSANSQPQPRQPWPKGGQQNQAQQDQIPFPNNG